jgi:hypothetical protein
MIKAHAQKAYRWIFEGICLYVGTCIFAFVFPLDPIDGTPNGFVGCAIILGCIGTFAILIASAVIFGRGCCMYAKAKGYAPIIGLMGLIPFVGWIALCVIPDLQKGSEIEGFAVVFSKHSTTFKK